MHVPGAGRHYGSRFLAIEPAVIPGSAALMRRRPSPSARRRRPLSAGACESARPSAAAAGTPPAHRGAGATVASSGDVREMPGVSGLRSGLPEAARAGRALPAPRTPPAAPSVETAGGAVASLGAPTSDRAFTAWPIAPNPRGQARTVGGPAGSRGVAGSARPVRAASGGSTRMPETPTIMRTPARAAGAEATPRLPAHRPLPSHAPRDLTHLRATYRTDRSVLERPAHGRPQDPTPASARRSCAPRPTCSRRASSTPCRSTTSRPRPASARARSTSTFRPRSSSSTPPSSRRSTCCSPSCASADARPHRRGRAPRLRPLPASTSSGRRRHLAVLMAPLRAQATRAGGRAVARCAAQQVVTLARSILQPEARAARTRQPPTAVARRRDAAGADPRRGHQPARARRPGAQRRRSSSTSSCTASAAPSAGRRTPAGAPDARRAAGGRR